jgi:hypothetical protein
MGRKEKKFHFIYKTTNLLSGKYYLGMHSTDDLNDGYMGSGRRLKYSLNKYGRENHKVEILEFLETRTELIKREEEIVNLNEIAKKDCINLRVGGEGGFRDEEHREKFFNSYNPESHKKGLEKQKWLTENNEEWVSNKRKKQADTLKRYIKENGNPFEGMSHTKDTKDKISESKKGQGVGKSNSQFGTCWITKGGENKKIKKELLTVYQVKGWTRGRK